MNKTCFRIFNKVHDDDDDDVVLPKQYFMLSYTCLVRAIKAQNICFIGLWIRCFFSSLMYSLLYIHTIFMHIHIITTQNTILIFLPSHVSGFFFAFLSFFLILLCLCVLSLVIEAAVTIFYSNRFSFTWNSGQHGTLSGTYTRVGAGLLLKADHSSHKKPHWIELDRNGLLEPANPPPLIIVLLSYKAALIRSTRPVKRR